MTINKNQLIQKRGDLSDFLVHLTRSGHFKRVKDLYSLKKDDFTQISGRDSLRAIIQNRRIEARSPFGYFNYKVKMERGTHVLNENSKVKREWLRAVCFTETPLDYVYLQAEDILGRNLHFDSYGLAFKETVVRQSGGNPIFYVHTGNQQHRDAFDAIAISDDCSKMRSLFPLVEGFGSPWFPRWGGPTEVDYRWEREWLSDNDVKRHPVTSVVYQSEAALAADAFVSNDWYT